MEVRVVGESDCQVCAYFYEHSEWPLRMIENDGTPVLNSRGQQRKWGMATHCTVDHRTWAAPNDGHCEECHEHFRGAGSFERHRVRGECHSREELENWVTESGVTFWLDEEVIWHYGDPDQTHPLAVSPDGEATRATELAGGRGSAR
jgi:hypothetical protein